MPISIMNLSHPKVWRNTFFINLTNLNSVYNNSISFDRLLAQRCNRTIFWRAPPCVKLLHRGKFDNDEPGGILVS